MSRFLETIFDDLESETTVTPEALRDATAGDEIHYGLKTESGQEFEVWRGGKRIAGGWSSRWYAKDYLAQLLNPQSPQPKEKSAMSHQDPYTHADLNGTLDRDETVSLERLAATVASLLPKESKKEQRTEPGSDREETAHAPSPGLGFTRPPAKPAPKKK